MRPNWFVGLPVPADGWLERLLAKAPAELRRMHPEDLHVTVAFFGAVSEERARAAWAVAAGLRAAPVAVRLSGLAAMGNPRRPSALSVVLDEGKDASIALIASVKNPMLDAAGVHRDERDIHPHITVARPARRARPAERRRAVAWASAVPPIGVWVTLDRIALYTWSEDRRERQFRVVQERAISGG